MPHYLTALLSLLLISSSFAEGTKQIRPTAASFGFFQIWDTPNGLNADRTFATFDGPEATRLYVRIADPTTETIAMGFQEMGLDPTYVRIKDPNGNVVFGPVLLATLAGEPGFIATYDEAIAGPDLVDDDGYLPLTYTPALSGDYIIELNPNSATIITQEKRVFEYFDITVVNDNDEAIDGRLWSRAMDLNTNGGNRSFEGLAYIYTNDGIVTSVDFEDFYPFAFVIQANSTGPFNTGNPITDRQSTTAGVLAPEYSVFISPPDTNAFPISSVPSINTVPEIDACSQEDSYCININLSNPGAVSVILDIDGSTGLDHARDVEIFQVVASGDNCIAWDGLDGQGNELASGDSLNLIIQYQSGITNLLLHDVEENLGGFTVANVYPTSGLSTPVLFFDDSLIGGAVELTGCTQLCHQWDNDFGDQKTINTWWATFFENDTIFDIPVFGEFMQDDVTASISASPNCLGANAQLNAEISTGDEALTDILWYLNGTLLDSGATTSPALVSEGDTIFAVSATSEKCHYGDTSFVIINLPLPDTASFLWSTNTVLCENDTWLFEAQNHVNTGSNANFYWSLTSNGTNGTSFSSSVSVTELTDTLIGILAPTEDCLLPDTQYISYNVLPQISPEITLTIDTSTVCSGDIVNLTADTSDAYGGSLEWLQNGQALLESGTAISVEVDSNTTFQAIVTSEYSCPSPPQDTSNEIQVTIIVPIQPEITISADEELVCPGTEVLFSADTNHLYGGVITWFQNGTQTGTNSTSFSMIIDQHTTIQAVGMSNFDCPLSTSDTSNLLEIEVISSEAPEITLLPLAPYCENEEAMVSFELINAISPDLQWVVNGEDVLAGNNFDASAYDANAIISVIASISNECQNETIASNEIGNPKVDFPENGILGPPLLCVGETTTLSAENTSTDLQWNIGTELISTEEQISISEPGTYLLFSTAADLCTSVDTITIGLIEVEVDAGPDVTVERGSEVQLTGSGNGDSTAWVDNATEEILGYTYEINFTAEQETTALIIESIAHCQALDVAQVNVIPPLHIPNVITPSGDSKNDEWIISGAIERGVSVTVFNRWGDIVYKNPTYDNTWQGKRGGQDLPMATYYYVVHDHFSNEEFSGSVCIIR